MGIVGSPPGQSSSSGSAAPPKGVEPRPPRLLYCCHPRALQSMTSAASQSSLLQTRRGSIRRRVWPKPKVGWSIVGSLSRQSRVSRRGRRVAPESGRGAPRTNVSRNGVCVVGRCACAARVWRACGARAVGARGCAGGVVRRPCKRRYRTRRPWSCAGGPPPPATYSLFAPSCLTSPEGLGTRGGNRTLGPP